MSPTSQWFRPDEDLSAPEDQLDICHDQLSHGKAGGGGEDVK